MKLAYMSSVCPAATVHELIDAARRFGYAAIEFRPDWKQGHGIEVESSEEVRREIRKRFNGEGVRPCCLSPGCKFTDGDPAVRDAQLERLRRCIELAADMEIPLIRVFADPLPKLGGGARTAAYRVHADYLARAAEAAERSGRTLVLETHGNCRAYDVGEILYQAAYPAALQVNWHLLHCLNHGEDVDEAYRHVKGRVRHVHFALDEKSPDMSDLKRQYDLLQGEGYDGYFSVEVINPADSTAVLQSHAEAWRRIKGGA